MNLLFLGLPGCGVRETARAAAERLGLRFVDTDEVLTRNLSMSLQDVYSLFTPEALRDLLERLAGQRAGGDGYCIAVGDCFLDEPGALETLVSSGRAVCLDLSPEEAVSVCREPDHPSLRRGLFRLRELYDERRGRLAAACDMILPADGRTPEDLAELAAARLAAGLPGRTSDALEENSRLLVPLLSARAELLGMTGDEKERYIAAVLTPGRDMTEGEI